MFHRRRTKSNPPRHTIQSSPHPAAASAATQAFAKSQQSNASLSAAAAAAALRSQTSTPAPVGSLQTKRMQRKDSNGSNGSSPSAMRPGVHRRGSAGSMTERTFRSQSPGRGNPNARVADSAPPVPSVPKDASQIDRTPSAHRRALSLDPPMRLSSPPPAYPGGRGVSLDRSLHLPASPRTNSRVTKLSNVAEVEREGSQRSSINFSRPMSPPNSPTTSSARPKSSGWFTGPVISGQGPRKALEPIKPEPVDGLPPAEISGIQQAIHGAANRPIRKKKRKATVAEGEHTGVGTMRLSDFTVKSSEGGAESSSVPPPHGESAKPSLEGEGESSRASIDSSKKIAMKGQPPPSNTQTGALSVNPPSAPEEAVELEEQTERANTGRKVDSAAAKPSFDSSRFADVAAASKALQTSDETVNAHLSAEPASADGTQRASSQSPARVAHFSVVPVELANGIKHHPPGRSMSPIKSALKHSPSSSVRTASPETRFAGSHNRSTSEPAETASEENSKPVQKKKTARVSFDDTPVAAVSGLEASKYARSPPLKARVLVEDELDEIMKPRPALPSFGSVRGRKRLEEGRDTSKPTEATSLEPSTPNPRIGLESSNDHAVGGILAHDFAKKEQTESPKSAVLSNEPLAPKVTSVEGTGYASDSESAILGEERAYLQLQEEEEAKFPPNMQTSQPSPAIISSQHVSTGTEMDRHHVNLVPAIAVLPATPAVEDEERLLSIPGAFPETPLEMHKEGLVDERAHHTLQPIQYTPTLPATESGALTTSSGQAPPMSEDSSDSDTSSVYSDAAEDPSELQGTFASLDAILESPVTITRPAPSAISTESQFTVDELPVEKPQPSPTAAHWDQTTTYWRGLSEQRRRELEERTQNLGEVILHSNEDVNRTERPRPATPPSAKKDSSHSPEQLPTSSSTQSSPTSKKPRHQSAIKLTLRNSRESESTDTRHQRNLLSTGGTMPTTLRRPNAGLEASKWSSPPQPKKPKGALQKKHIPMSAASSHFADSLGQDSPTSKAPPLAALQRTDSTGSESSFKRQRTSSPLGSDGKVILRRSMRHPPPQEQHSSPQPISKSGKFSLRPLSSAETTTPSHHMRSSMRGSIDSGSPTLRSQDSKSKSRLKSPTRLGFGKSKKEKATKTQPASKYKSRFAADSDDDEPRPMFVSRFADSDDELDSPVTGSGLPPVRGIPRKPGEEDGDSTELEDEDEGDERNEIPPTPPVPSLTEVETAHRSAPVTNGNVQGTGLVSGSRPNSRVGLAASKHAPQHVDTKKGRLSFLGIGKKRASSVHSEVSHSSVAGSSPRSPKLQRRTTPSALSQVPEDSWPLPLPPKFGASADGDGRPNTSDGMSPQKNGIVRPEIGKRRSTADEVSPAQRRVNFSTEPIYSQKTGRKKKFPTLRRMFGLND